MIHINRNIYNEKSLSSDGEMCRKKQFKINEMNPHVKFFDNLFFKFLIFAIK